METRLRRRSAPAAAGRPEQARPDEPIAIALGFNVHAARTLHVEGDREMVRMALARRLCGGRVISVLEGGYVLPALARSVAAHLDALLG